MSGPAHPTHIKLLTSFDGGDIHQESWSWVGSRGRDCSEKNRDKAEGQERLTVRYIYLSWATPPYVCGGVWGCVTYAT